MSKFTVAGVSKLNGEFKVRFANDLEFRHDTLVKNGHEDVQLVELSGPLTKADACAELLASGKFDAHRTLLEATMNKKTGAKAPAPAVKAKATAKAKAPKTAPVKKVDVEIETLTDEQVEQIVADAEAAEAK